VSAVAGAFDDHRVALDLLPERALSNICSPDTPPPQPIA
jgi:hypothetical protein